MSPSLARVLRSTAAYLSLCCCLTLPASAAKHKRIYHDGVLVDFHRTSAGKVCSSNGDVNGTVDDSGNVRGETHSDSVCTPRMRAYYTVEVEGHSYVLTPAPSLSKAGVAFLTMGIGAAVFRNSALYGVLPGTPVKVSSEGNGTFYVKLGKRMSAYKLESAK